MGVDHQISTLRDVIGKRLTRNVIASSGVQPLWIALTACLRRSLYIDRQQTLGTDNGFGLFAAFGIRVLTIAPGLFLAPLLNALPEEAQKSLGDSIPYPRRLGAPEEFASLVAHMVENRFLNGEVVRLDGALRLPPK